MNKKKAKAYADSVAGDGTSIREFDDSLLRADIKKYGKSGKK